MPSAPVQRPDLACPLCRNTSFHQEESRQESKWGFTNHRMTLLICTQCSYVLHFWGGRSYFDID
ncbi:MAG: hypothetical protein U0Q15_21070 [Kineosporiaceae bacterium]